MTVKEKEGNTKEDILKKEAAVHKGFGNKKNTFSTLYLCCRKGRR